MKNTPIRILVILGALTMSAIVLIQVYWVTKAINHQKVQFKHSVQMALRTVVEGLCQINGNDIPSNDPIDQLSNNYFIARTNYKIDLNSLDYLLKAELQKRNIDEDYEFGVYDCQTDRMVYGDYVPLSDKSKKVTTDRKLPLLVNDEYYFGVFFPEMDAGVSGLGVWKVTTLLTIVILIIFGYALFVILRQRRLSEIQRDFINNMTHEFKTPLATLKVSSEFLLNESSSERQKKYAAIVMSETDRLQMHVQQLLETSLTDHKASERKEEINIHEVIMSICQRLEGNSERSIQKLMGDPSLRLIGDPSRFENIMYNLLDNAMKYGRDMVEVKIQDLDKKLWISVSNDGPAIPEREQKRIFRKFYRINSGDLHDVKGFGLGLYFVKNAVKQFGGRIKLISQNDRTTFTLVFPL